MTTGDPPVSSESGEQSAQDPSTLPEPRADATEDQSGAQRLSERLAQAQNAGGLTSPRPSPEDREIFFTLLGYHYGRGTLDEAEFSRRWSHVESAQSLAELYEANSDLTFPPPLANLSDRSVGSQRRRRWFLR
jgi:hypothetical protein